MSEAQFAAWLAATYPNPASKIAVAFSGGGDSLALLILTLRYAGSRPVYALSVDHALQDGSAEQISAATQQAQALGAIAHRLYWNHGEIKSGVQEAARKGRYGLMGDFCRERRISSLLVAHSRDDQAETLWMRKQCGGGWRAMAGISARSFAPVWPELRDITLLRPLLGWSREHMRDVCRDAGETWHEDPSNVNLDYLRVQARSALAYDEVLASSLLQEGDVMRSRREAEEDRAQGELSRVALSDCGSASIPKDVHLSELAMARLLMCVSGNPQMADMARVRALLESTRETGYVSQTLGGCVIYRAGDELKIARETGRWLKMQQSMPLQAHHAMVFDGRYEITANQKGLAAAPLWPARRQLSQDEKSALNRFDALSRRVLFGVFDGDDLVYAPHVQRGDIQWRGLTSARLYQQNVRTGAKPA